MKTSGSPTEAGNSAAAICERLKQVRVQVCGPRGQSHFAALLQLSPSTYNYYEKGRIPPVDVLDRASQITNVPLLWLIRGEPPFAVESLKKIEPLPSLPDGPSAPAQPDLPVAILTHRSPPAAPSVRQGEALDHPGGEGLAGKIGVGSAFDGPGGGRCAVSPGRRRPWRMIIWQFQQADLGTDVARPSAR